MLIAELGRLRLALTLQNVQVPIIGSFQRGTLQVPETGLYQLHAGEKVTPSGVRRGGGDGMSIGDIVIRIDGDSAQAEALRRMMHGVAVQAAPSIARAHGEEAQRRRRGGRF